MATSSGGSSSAKPSGKARDVSKLKLANLPRYHPSNHQFQKPGRPAASQQQKSQISETQRKLQAYQREIVRNATLASHSATTGGTPRPESPRLAACGSPGPCTPFMLEDVDPFSSSPRNPESPLRTPTQEEVR
jgi:hypothetical protein